MKLSEFQRLTSTSKPKRQRTNRGNDGRRFQEEVQNSINEFRHDGKVITAFKIDPPVRIMGSGQQRKTIFLKNPFLDFTGSYHDPERGQHIRMDFEVKTTQTDRLPVNAKGGITQNQIESIRHWIENGSNVFVLWQVKPKNDPNAVKVGFIAGVDILDIAGSAGKAVRFNDHRVSSVPLRVSVFGLTWGFYGHILKNSLRGEEK